MKKQQVVIITGAAGFLGSALAVTLSQNYNVVAIDVRKPSNELIAATPSVQWFQLNIADSKSVGVSFQQFKNDYGQIDFVIHLAAYYHFGKDWRKEYERTNIEGTENIVKAAIANDMKRILFASSIMALGPPIHGQILNENSPTSDYIPYAKSKSMGEKIIRDNSNQLPGIIIRFGGIFSDWCELPPLYSLIKLWARPGLLGRIMLGRGESGFPYIYRNDAMEFVKRCLKYENQLKPLEIFLAAQNCVVYQKEIFASIKKYLDKQDNKKPISISPGLARIGLFTKLAVDKLTGNPSFERPWMLKFVDLPIIVDNSFTEQKLNWQSTDKYHLLERLSIILGNKLQQSKNFTQYNQIRNEGQYQYHDQKTGDYHLEQ